MNTLAEDLEEVQDAPDRVRRFVANSRRARGIHRSEPTCWFADLECGEHAPHKVTLGRSPADVLLTAKSYAEARSYYKRVGTGRWIIESAAGDEDADSLILLVYPRPDGDAS